MSETNDKRIQSYRDLKVYKLAFEFAEKEVWLDFALKCTYIEKKDHSELKDNYDYMCRMLTKKMNNPEQWCVAKGD